MTVEGSGGQDVQLNLLDIGSYEQVILVNLPLAYQHDRDYFRSAINVLTRQGFRFNAGIEGEVRGTIPKPC
jgi:galactokinase